MATLNFDCFGLTFEAIGSYYGGSPGGMYEPPEEPDFECDRLSVLHDDGTSTDCSWLLDSSLCDQLGQAMRDAGDEQIRDYQRYGDEP